MLQSISLRDFRSFESASWVPGRGQHLLVGENGVGKTSILEAIYFLATTRSFRSSRLADCRRWGQESFWVRGRLDPRHMETETDLVASWQRGGAQRQVNGKPAVLGDYLSLLPAFSWSTRDDPLIDGEPQARRRLLDQGIVAGKPLAVDVLSRYRRVLEAKRRLLTDRERSSSGETLESWNRLLAEAGHELIRLRSTHADELGRAFRETLAEREVEMQPIEFLYRPSPEAGAESVESFEVALASRQQEENRRRRCLLGPHRDRLEIRWGMADIGRAASAGERKLFGLVLTAARRRILAASGKEPLILLDDLDATLDERHLGQAWRLFAEAPQVLATSADPASGQGFEELRSWRLEDGLIERI